MAPAAGSNTVHHQAAKAVVKQEGTRPSCAGIDQEKQFCVQLLETYSGKEGHLAAIAVICQEHAYKGTEESWFLYAATSGKFQHCKGLTSLQLPHRQCWVVSS